MDKKSLSERDICTKLITPARKRQEIICKVFYLIQLYVNLNEMEDKKYGLSKEDYIVTIYNDRNLNDYRKKGFSVLNVIVD
jgi:hypothetical protein